MDVSDADRHWLAGLMEGEGSFMKATPSYPGRPIMSLRMTDHDVVQRVADLWGVRSFRISRDNPRHKPIYSLRVVGQRAVAWMELLRPLMGIRRRAQIDAALATYVPAVTRFTDEAEVTRRFDAGETAIDLAAVYGVRRESIYRMIRRHRS